MSDAYHQLLADLDAFVQDEHLAAEHKLRESWEQPLAQKLAKGLTQSFVRIETTSDPKSLLAYLGDNESRFREGDLLLLHLGDPFQQLLARRLALEADDGDRWRLRSHEPITLLDDYDGGVCYADADTIDLRPFYEKAIADIATSSIGQKTILPLLAGHLEPEFDPSDCDHGEAVALSEGFNKKQAAAVGTAYGAQHIACIQGPPGTGKTKVLSLIARMLVERGERVLLTSHTHMAINNALNRIHRQKIPTVKIGRLTQTKGLDAEVDAVEAIGGWEDRPKHGGYVVGATPFATGSQRLDNYQFDTVIFDEASQVTVPLAVMAMRTARKYIFIGDQKQLPPVVLSKSILEKDSFSVFARLIHRTLDAVMLDETYRMNQWLTSWPSQTYYGRKLVSAGANRDRRLNLVTATTKSSLVNALDPQHSGVFIPTNDLNARTRNLDDAKLVVELCEAAIAGGLAPTEIGIVSPYRAQGKAIRNLLAAKLGKAVAQLIVADTVERMQGQERELIILAMTTGDPVFLAAIAEFFFQPERLNVSITRAMTKLIVIGPSEERLPTSETDYVNGWIGQYRSFIETLKHIEV
ncbi:MAG: DNA helicase [Betaproteobacteria bacterium]|nr:MAG: DNA helicase [Betaproteobacteria bacterium]